MSRTILLISTDDQLYEHIASLLDGETYDLVQIRASDLMQQLFLLNPFYIMIDLDTVSPTTIGVVKATQDLEYVPAMFISQRNLVGEMAEALKGDVLLNSQAMTQNLRPLLKQAADFKSQFDSMASSFSTIDALTTETKKVMDQYLLQDYGDFCYSAMQLINNTFSDNPILSNKPKNVFVVYPEYTGRLICMFQQMDDGSYRKHYEGMLLSTEAFGFDVHAENGFKMNLQTEQYSDIDTSVKLFPDQISDRLLVLNNFAGFGMDELLVIGCNYDVAVSHHDASVLKSMTVTLDLIENIRHQIHEVEESFKYTMDALARAAEASDDLTGHHIRRVNEYSRLIAEELGLDRAFVKSISHAAQMHDVGKIYVDNNILSKRGKLTDEEFREMQLHTVYGERIIGQSENLTMSAEIALNHHEKWDGSGYPNGLKGEDIPISARIVSLADVYDALRSERPYKAGFTHEETTKIILEGDGRVEPKHFDPDILEVYRKKHEDFRRIFDRLA